MPATEKTWRNQSWLHAVFGVTGVLMLIATVWMFYADHEREWKDTQRTYVDIETRVASWREQAMAESVEQRHEELMSRLLSVRAQPVARNLVTDFVKEVQTDIGRRAGDDENPEATTEVARVDEQEGQGERPMTDEERAEAPADFERIEELSQTSLRRGDRAVTLRELAEKIDDLLTEAEQVEQTQQAQRAAPASPGGPAVSARDQTTIADQAFELSEQASDLAERAADSAESEENPAFQAEDAGLLKRIAAALQEAGQAAAEAEMAIQADKLEEARVARRLSGEKLTEAYEALDAIALEAEAASAEVRDQLLTQLRDVLYWARFREDSLLRERKFKAAEYDEARANRDLYVRDNRTDLIPEAQAKIDRIKAQLDALTIAYQAAAQHRRDLQEIVQQITAETDAVQKEIDDNNAELERIATSIEEQRSTFFTSKPPYLGKRWLELPILDAFNSPRKIDNLWTEGLTMQYGSFSQVRRFDRCTTCHQAIQKTMPGSAVEPAYPHGEEFLLVLSTPDKSQLEAEFGPSAGSAELTLDNVYGLRLADRGLIERDEVAVSFVRDNSRAAGAVLASNLAQGETRPGNEILEALLHTEGWDAQLPEEPQPGLMIGDVILQINDTYISDRDQAERMLLRTVEWGEPVRLRVRRGLPHPYATHPRLDLFVGSLSPHPMNTFGCTVCHEGQGSATSFKWASHTPNTPREAEEWREQYGWFYNHHWIFPMHPERFAESTCLKCHHDVTELEPSERFPEPPAPKLTKGYELIAKYGCYGCHEINGYDGPDRRIGPDLRLEPNYFAAAQQLLAQIPERRDYFEDQIAQVAEKLEEAAGEGGVLQGVDLDNVAELQQRGQALQQELDAWAALADSLDDATKQRLDAIRDVLPQLTAIAQTGERLEKLNEIAGLAEQLVEIPEGEAARRDLHRLILQDIELAMGERAESIATDPSETAEVASVLSRESHRLEPLFKDIEVPGAMRKPGPALRYVASKDDMPFLLDWIRKPSHFRADTRMPQFFELHDHLMPHGDPPDLHPTEDEPGEGEKTPLQVAEDLEPVEILGITLYLLDRSQEFDFLEPPEDIADWTEEEKIARGKIQFETRGCLACHDHNAFPDAAEYRFDGEIVHGPDLSGVGSKFDPQRNPVGPQWLYTWIKEPTRYHPRTKMPDVFLDPYEDAEGNRIDPAADIVAFLLSTKDEDWRPIFDNDYVLGDDGELEEDSRADLALRDLSLEFLKATFYEKAAEEYYENGVPEELRDELKGAEVELISDDLNDRQRLIYVGSKAISKYGCYGCHDIPGFEDAKPIGTGLADWGRKDTSRLAFEHITHYIHEQEHTVPEHGEGEAHEPAEEPLPPFFEEALEAHHREGFLFQKLREPRSYDYAKADNKGYNEWLRMPQFPFDNEEREQVATFILGLVAEPPAEKFVYQPDERERAIQEGRRVLAKFNCGGCHTLEMEKWEISFPPGEFREPPPMEMFSFVRPEFTPEQLTASQQTDRRGMLHGVLVGQPFIGNDGFPMAFDELGDPVEPDIAYDPATLQHLFQLFEPAALDGKTYAVGPAPFTVKASLIDKTYPAHGGYLARYLVPRVIELEREVNPAAKASEAWGWVPPPLVGEGEKVQPDWLYNFLLNPYPIRPAAFLRMPKFNMSGAEAQALVNYFAAKDNAAYPYNALAHRQPGVLEAKELAYEAGDRFDDAMDIVTNNAGCVKCHLVGDYAPQGFPRSMAPNLADVYRRMRADYVRHWIAKPDNILPYTGMPVNINPHTGFATQGLYEGTPEEQLDALVDLLMSYDQFAQQKTSIADLVQTANPQPAEGEAAPGAEGAAPATEQPAPDETPQDAAAPSEDGSGGASDEAPAAKKGDGAEPARPEP